MSRNKKGEITVIHTSGSSVSRIPRLWLMLGGVVLLMTCLPAGTALASGVCTHTADMIAKACSNEVQDDYWTAQGICENLTDAEEQATCQDEAAGDRQDARDDCSDQEAARDDLCDLLGEDAYDPDFDPADFETEFTGLNPYWLLVPGYSWTFVSEDETDTVEVLDKTKLIEGVTCIVVHDEVAADGQTTEDTFDWYGQASNGDVHYCGEISLSLETFEGDNPEEPEVVDIEGSWKAGRDGAKPGIVMFRYPEVGAVYRQELSWGDAEDAAEVMATDYSYGKYPELDELVPQALAELLCDDDCVVTREFTPVEPDVEAFKYYAPGIGVFLEVEDGSLVQLTGCNFDPICAMLPAP
jgi:hypothetical protein